MACAAPLSTCARTRTASVSIAGPARYDLLACVDNNSARVPLVTRAVANGSITFVADFFQTQIGINATSEVLLRLCSTGNCEPLPNRRATFTVGMSDVSLPPNPTLLDWGHAISAALNRWPVTDNAPDGLIIMRLVATTQPAGALVQLDSTGRYPRLETDSLIGCTISPPVDFDAISSTVYLSLPAFGTPCVLPQVALCAQGQ